jgi:uncharacterized protein (TIRG00374 family)
MTLSTVIIERILDVVTLTLFLYVASIFVSYNSFLYIEIASFVLVAAMFCVLVVVYKFDKVVIHLLGKRVSSLPRSIGVLKKGLKKISENPFAILVCFLLSVPAWLLEIAGIYFAGRSIGYDLTFLQTIIAGVVAFIAQALPLTPAGLGIHEATITGILLLFSVPVSSGMSIALVDHFARGITVLIIGIPASVLVALASRPYFGKNFSNNDSFDRH